MSAKIVIAVPARDTVHSGFAFDLAIAMAYHTFHHPDDDLYLCINYGTMIASQREELVRWAQGKNATHILFLDSDMRFPKNIIKWMRDRMAQIEIEGQPLRILAANCAKRRRPTCPTARRTDPEGSDLKPVWTEPDYVALQEVHTVGQAVMMVDMSVYDELDRPWHSTPWIEKDGNWSMVGEDVYFVGMAYKKGIRTFVDHGLSQQIGHIGTYTYDNEDAIAERDGLWHKDPDKWEGWRPLGSQ